MVSFDALTIYADRVRLDSRSSTLEAQGNVVVEDGKRRLKISNAEIDLKATCVKSFVVCVFKNRIHGLSCDHAIFSLPA